MTQKDMESIVAGIKKLSGVIVITVPDCLLYSAWQASEDDWDAEVTGAYFGQLLASGVDGVRSVEAWRGLSQMTIEFEQGLMIVRPTPRGKFAIGYVFEPDTPLGWIRMQVERTYHVISEPLDRVDVGDGDGDEDEAPSAAPEEAPPKPAPAKEEPPKAAAPAKTDAPKAAKSGEPPTVAGVKMTKTPASKPADAPKGAASGNAGEGKGTRLIKYLGENTGDTHAALLRVSLQTGLPLTRLREPDKLSEEEYAKVEESVRLILGVDQINL